MNLPTEPPAPADMMDSNAPKTEKKGRARGRHADTMPQTPTADYRWIITDDLLDGGDDNDYPSAVGTEGPREADPNLTANPVKFAMYDDDGTLYYKGTLYGRTPDSYEGFEPLDDFGRPNAGCTGIKISGKWL